jgi:hypothetical protein
MTDQEQTITTEVLDTTTPVEDVSASTVEDIAKETINEVNEPAVESAEEEVTIDNVELPVEKKKLTAEDPAEDHILQRKERQIERERKRILIDQKDAEIDRLKQAAEEARKREFSATVNSIQAPIRENFESDEEFIDSRLQYNIAKHTAERIREEEQVHAAKLKDVFVEKLSKTEQNGQDKYQDFDDAVSDLGKPGVLTNKTLVDAVVDSDYSADIFYILGKNPALREKLNAMEPMKAVKEIARLEQRFEQVIKAKKVVKPPIKIIETINGKNGTATKKPLSQYTPAELDRLDNKEFTRLRKEQSKFTTY